MQDLHVPFRQTKAMEESSRIWMPRETWLSGLPEPVREAIAAARAGAKPPSGAFRLLRMAGKWAETGILPGKASGAAGVPMRPTTQASVAAELYALAEDVRRNRAARRASA